MTDRPFLSVTEAAAMLGVRRQHMLALLHAGEIRCSDCSVKGKRPRWRIAREDLDAFLLRRTHQAAPPRIRRRRRSGGIVITKNYFND